MNDILKKIFIGIILGAIVSSMTAFATTSTITKDVTYRNIKIVVEGTEITPTDANGSPVEPFIMDGTTYLPVRAISSALGKGVSWDDATNTVSLGNQPSQNQSVVGTYTTPYPFNLTLTLNADNSGNLTNGDQTADFTWIQNGSKLTLNPTNPEMEPESFTIDGNRLISDKDEYLFFTKINETAPKEAVPAATVQKDVTYRDIKIVVDGNAITPTDANGSPVEPFIMDGTTYLPVRAVANAFGKEVGWNDTTSTVYLGVQPAESTSVVGKYTSTYPTAFTLTLNADNTGNLNFGNQITDFTWVQNGNKLTLNPINPALTPDILTINGDRLILDEDVFLTFTKNGDITPASPKATITMKTITVDKTDANKPIVTIEMANGGIIKAELYPDVAPISVENFISLIEKGFYDGLTFHRNIPGFVIQGGCPVGNGTSGPGYTIKGEFSSNGVKNDLKHTRGILSMARAMDPDSAGSQFFIMHADAPHLDGEYAAFGKVIEGMDVVDAIATSGI